MTRAEEKKIARFIKTLRETRGFFIKKSKTPGLSNFFFFELIGLKVLEMRLEQMLEEAAEPKEQAIHRLWIEETTVSDEILNASELEN